MIPDDPVLPFTPLEESQAAADPFTQFSGWLGEAVNVIKPEPYAMTLATSTAEGSPSARMVLLRGFDERGFVFYTCYESRKGRELRANARAALVFYWGPLHRQVRVEGKVQVVTAEESDAYFHSRPRESQLAAWASAQSEVVPDRATLEQRMAELEQKYEAGVVPRPPQWGGFRVVPEVIEFWQGRLYRLHDRLRYTRQPDGTWRRERLAP
ncbi:MAG: pyridoxamine 5'-phosphate oxidase [Gemmataceae bacterium]